MTAGAERKAAIGTHLEGGGRIAAVFPVHGPRALLRAFGYLPTEVWGPPGVDTTSGDVHLQAYTCSIVRSGLAALLDGTFSAAEVLVVPHTCDSLQGLGSLLLDFVKPGVPVLPLYLPKGTDEAAVAYLAAELGALYSRLAEITGERPSDEDLLEATKREEAADEALAELLEARAHLDLSEPEVFALARSREYLPAEVFTLSVKEALAEVRPEPRSGVRVLLSGMLPEPADLLDVLTASGAVVVADDLACCGRRTYPAGTSDDPLERMAQRLIGAPPGPTRGSPIDERGEHLIELARRSRAQAVVFWIVKFCEPELFYLPLLRKRLDAAGLRSVVVEIDVSDPLPGQVRTRVEALLETVA